MAQNPNPPSGKAPDREPDKPTADTGPGVPPPPMRPASDRAGDPAAATHSVAGVAAQPPTDEERKQEADAGEKAAERFGSTPVPYTENFAAAPSLMSDSDMDKARKEAGAAADEREKRAAVKRGATEEAVQDYHDNVVWLMDNRADDRVVLHERDPLHPMGEVFFAAGVPRRAYLTPNVQHLLQTGELMPVPEPKRTIVVWDEDQASEIEIPNPKYPDQNLPDPGVAWAAQPGRPVPLGRTYIDPDYFEAGEVRAIRTRQAGLPSYVPLAPGGIVPPEVQQENEEFMQKQRATGRSPRR